MCSCLFYFTPYFKNNLSNCQTILYLFCNSLTEALLFARPYFLSIFFFLLFSFFVFVAPLHVFYFLNIHPYMFTVYEGFWIYTRIQNKALWAWSMFGCTVCRGDPGRSAEFKRSTRRQYALAVFLASLDALQLYFADRTVWFETSSASSESP